MSRCTWNDKWIKRLLRGVALVRLRLLPDGVLNRRLPNSSNFGVLQVARDLGVERLGLVPGLRPVRNGLPTAPGDEGRQVLGH